MKLWHGAVIGVALALLTIKMARGHEHWINNGKYLDPNTGLHCCNENDCKQLTPQQIKAVIELPGRQLIVDQILFKANQVHVSEDGKWYRCVNRCVFRPHGGTT